MDQSHVWCTASIPVIILVFILTTLQSSVKVRLSMHDRVCVCVCMCVCVCSILLFLSIVADIKLITLQDIYFPRYYIDTIVYFCQFQLSHTFTTTLREPRHMH